jgi:hypothetical protein
MDNNNSIKEYYIKLEKMMNNAVNILTALNTALTSSAQEISVDLVDVSGKSDIPSTLKIPSFIYIENKIERLDNIISTLFDLPKTGEAWFDNSSNLHKLKLVKANHAPAALNISNNDNLGFNIKDNNIFKDLVNPKTYIRLNIPNVSDNINQILVKKIILNNASDANRLKEYSTYDEIKSALYNKTIGSDYEEYDSIINMPIKSDRYYSYFKIESCEKLESADNSFSSEYKLKLDTLLYYDKDDHSIQYQLRKGDYLCLGDEYVIYKVKNVQTRYNTLNNDDQNEYIVTIEENVGHMILQTTEDNSEMYLKYYNSSYEEYHYVDVALEENPNIIIFIAAIYDNVRSTYSNAIHLDLNNIYMKDNNGNLILDNDGNKISYIEYYNTYCKNIGDIMLDFTKLSYPQLSKYSNLELRRLTDSDELKELVTSTLYTNDELVLSVSRINSHLIDDASSENIINLHSQKNEINSQLRTVQDNVDQVYSQLTTTDFSQESTVSQESLKAQLNEYYNERITLEKQLLTIVDNINLAKSNVIGLDESKFRVRGITDANDKYDSAIESPIIAFLHNTFGYDCDVIGLEVEYKYKSAVKDSNNIVNTNNIIFTDWNKLTNIERERYLKFDPSTNKYVLAFSNYNAISNVIKWNQIDIPINQGEDVVIRIRYKYNIGQPFINLYTPWSNEVEVAFPAEFNESTEISSILTTNDNDVIQAKFMKTLINDGYEDHITNKIVDNSQVFYHMPENIYSGFNTPENNLISLKDKLIDMCNEIASYKSAIDNEINSKYEVLLEWDNTTLQLSNMTSNNVVINELINGSTDTFIKKKLNLIIKNTGAVPIKLYSIFPGNIDTTLLESDNKYFDNIISNYERVPMLLEGSSIPSESIIGQNMGQWIYFRQNNPFTNISLYYDVQTQNDQDSLYILNGRNPEFNLQLINYIGVNNKQALLPYRNRKNIFNASEYWGKLTLSNGNVIYEIGTGDSNYNAYENIKDLYLYANADTSNEYILKYEHLVNTASQMSDDNYGHLSNLMSFSEFIKNMNSERANIKYYNGAFLIPELVAKTQILCDTNESNQYKLLDVGKSLSIPLLFEYFLVPNDTTSASVSKTLAFDLKPSLMKEVDHYILTVTAKYDYSQTIATTQSYTSLVDGIKS